MFHRAGTSHKVYVGRGVLTSHPKGRLWAHLFPKEDSPLGKGGLLATSSKGYGLGGWGGACGHTWVLEGQATIAWVFLELDLLQGEDGGS